MAYYIYICSLLRQFACSLNDKMCDGKEITYFEVVVDYL